MRVHVLGLVLLLASSGGFASIRLTEGVILPDIQISAGRLLWSEIDQSVHYTDWNSRELLGKPTLLYHLAGTSAASKLNRSFINLLKEQHFPEDHFHFVTVVNLDEALWGTSLLVKSNVEDRQQRYPRNIFVLDESGSMRDQLELQPKSAALILQDAAGRVIRFHEGGLSEQQQQEWLQLIRSHVAP